MLAYRLLQPQTQPEFQEVPEPRAGPGQVVVRVAGSGLCHTDFTVISRDRTHWGNEQPPFTLGHEVAGWIEEVGTGVTKFQPGDAVAINPSWASCGRCHMCRSGEENHCLYQKGIRAPGVGYNGGHAPYILVPGARFLVPIGDLDPILAAPLTDAGITTYSAIKPALPGIWPGSTAVVIGVGGLGLYAVQFLRLLTGAHVVAVDSTEARLKLARDYGATTWSPVVLMRRNRFASSAAGSARRSSSIAWASTRPLPPGSRPSRGAAVFTCSGRAEDRFLSTSSRCPPAPSW